jgi:hypothetical protein|nr:MAG TPA_asm: Protein of unknown function (DUF3852) [Caudoviricetes sp.]
MRKKIICAVMAGVIAATCAAPAFACTPTIKVDMSWKKDMDKALSGIKVSVPNVVIPSSYFDNVKFN